MKYSIVSLFVVIAVCCVAAKVSLTALTAKFKLKSLDNDSDFFFQKEKRDSEKRQAFLTEITSECSKEINFDLDSGMKLLLGDLSINSDKAKVDLKLKPEQSSSKLLFHQCFIRCVFKKEGYLNENDEAQIETIVDSVSGSVNLKQKVLTKFIEKCAKQRSDNPCDAAFKVC